MTMRRQRGWERRLVAAIEAGRARSFEWGAFDCGLFLADVTLAMTEVDHGEPFRGKYTTAEGAAVALRRFAGGGLDETLTKVFGEPIDPNFARRGDAVVVGTDLGPAAGVVGVDGTLVHVVAPERGLTALPRDAVLKAWRVG